MQELEVSKISFKSRMDKQSVAYPYDKILFSKKKKRERNEVSRHENTWRKHKSILLSERSQLTRLYTV